MDAQGAPPRSSSPRPSPYAKRWWSVDLSMLRTNYTYWRNQASAARRVGQPDHTEEQRALLAKKDYFIAMKAAKKQHFDETDNVLKADLTATFARIPTLVVQDRTIDSNADIAQALRQTFFPPLPPIIGFAMTFVRMS
jgi:hypothetical protein